MTVASAQIAQLGGDPEETYGLQVISGEMAVDALMTEKLALVFFVPTDCEACEVLIEEGLHEFDALPFVLITSGATPGLDGWLEHHSGLNVWLDSSDELARELSVKEAPTVFMVDSGAVVNADYWPFYGGIEGLVGQLEYFATAPPSPRAATIVEDLKGRTLDGISGITASGQDASLSGLDMPRLLMVCWPGCSVCASASEYYRYLYSSENDLPPLTILLVADEREAGDAIVAWDLTDLEVLRIEPSSADFLDLPRSPVNIYVDAHGLIDWVTVGFSPSIGDRLSGSEGSR